MNERTNKNNQQKYQVTNERMNKRNIPSKVRRILKSTRI